VAAAARSLEVDSMPILGDKRNTALTTLVGFHDLLGFGDLLSASGGTLDSAVGQLAYKRVLGLRQSVAEIKDEFPAGTHFFHFNDTVTAYLDIEIDIASSHTDPGGIAAFPVHQSEYEKVLRFVSGCASLHQRSIAREDEERLGPAGRTFVVLGKRWDLGSTDSEQVFEVPPLHANLAFAEAYAADASGAKHGFSHRTFSRLYVNDYVWFVLVAGHNTLSEDQQKRLSALGDPDKAFPENFCSRDAKPITLEVFHRQRIFRSLMSHHACDIRGAL
jgi:hypothetical protein